MPMAKIVPGSAKGAWISGSRTDSVFPPHQRNTAMMNAPAPAISAVLPASQSEVRKACAASSVFRIIA